MVINLVVMTVIFLIADNRRGKSSSQRTAAHLDTSLICL